MPVSGWSLIREMVRIEIGDLWGSYSKLTWMFMEEFMEVWWSKTTKTSKNQVRITFKALLMHNLRLPNCMLWVWTKLNFFLLLLTLKWWIPILWKNKRLFITDKGCIKTLSRFMEEKVGNLPNILKHMPHRFSSTTEKSFINQPR